MLNLFASLSVNSVLLQAPYFVCPIEYSTELEQMTMSCEPSLLFRQQVGFWKLGSFLLTLISRSGGCPSRPCAPGRVSWSTRRPWPSTPSSSMLSGCPSLHPSSDPLEASLLQASRGPSRSRILEISYQDMVVLWTGIRKDVKKYKSIISCSLCSGLTVNSWWRHLWTCTSTVSSTYQPQERSSSKSSCYCQRSSWSSSESWKPLCFKGEYCNPELFLVFFFGLDSDQLLSWVLLVSLVQDLTCLKVTLILRSAFVINLCDPNYLSNFFAGLVLLCYFAHSWLIF